MSCDQLSVFTTHNLIEDTVAAVLTSCVMCRKVQLRATVHLAALCEADINLPSGIVLASRNGADTMHRGYCPMR